MGGRPKKTQSHLFLSYLSLLLKRVNIKYGKNKNLPSNQIYHIFILSIKYIKVELNYYNIFFYYNKGKLYYNILIFP